MATTREAGLVPAETNGKAEVEEDVMKQKQEELQEQSLIPVKEDLAEWIARTIGIDITTNTFMDILDNGVYLCKLANVIQKKAEECVSQGTYTEPLPDIKLKCKNNAPSGSWFARDNTANFLSWCKAYGMQGESMFETEDLVCHKMEKSVINCILELARIGYKFGLDPPNLIKMEKEIEKEEETPVQIVRPTSKPSNLDLDLDDEVRRIAFLCKCHDHIKKLGEGKYLIFGKVVQIRFLKNRHLMVRVGGGWDTLENYLLHHRPIEIFEHKRVGGHHTENHLDKKYLYIKSQYIS